MLKVVGQDAQVELFIKTANKGMLAHSFIVSGPDGVGKSIFAYFMAQYLFCMEENKPCGKCINCIRIKNKNHPDVIEIMPKKSIGVDDIRDLNDKINTKPYEGDKKVVIIKNADLITVQGQNAFLKTLEEPPYDTTIIMLVENINLILDTIKSRCQMYKFNRIQTSKVKEYLLGVGVSLDKAELFAELSDGIIGNALNMLDTHYTILRNETSEILSTIINFKRTNFLEVEDFFMENKDKIDDVFDILLSFLRDISLYKNTVNEELVLNKDKLPIIIELSRSLSYNRLNKLLDIMLNIRSSIKKNANYQMAITALLISIQEV